MNALPDDLPDCMVFWLAKAYQRAHAVFKARLVPYGLTNLQHLVLEALWYRPGITAAQMSKMLTLDKATLSGILDRMVRGDWITKSASPGDRRQMALFTTAKADSHKQTLIRERKEANNRLMSEFTTEERILFKRFLMDMVRENEQV